jgi:uncharacterized protein (DUF58 family)
MTNSNPETDRLATLSAIRAVNKLISQSFVGIDWASGELQLSSNERTSARHGLGEEERGVKLYEAGDSVRNIHLAATMASPNEDEILIRTFFQASVVRLNVLLNVGASMNFGTHGTFKTFVGAACAGAGIQSAILSQDIPSFVTYSSRPLTSRIEYNASDILFESLIRFVEDGSRAERRSESGGLAKAYQAVRHLDRSVTLVVDDFANLSSADWEALRLLACQHEVIAAFVQDPRERELPEVPWPGASYTLEDCLGQVQSFWVTPSKLPAWMASLTDAFSRGKKLTSRQEYADNWKRHEEEVLNRLRKSGIKTVTVSTDKARDDVRKLVRVLSRQTR